MRAALVLLVLTSTVGAQEGTGPPAAVTTGRVSGKVVTEAGLPLAGATVAIPSSSNSLLTTDSDANGAFDFPRVPAGSHRLVASRSGFFLKGRGTASSTGPVLTVRAGQSVPPVTLTMSRGGAVIGRIVDEFGDPIEQLLVNALRHSYQPDGRRVVYSAGVSDLTDDRGEFRVYGLTPGDYVVVASVRTTDDSSMPGLNNPATPIGSAPTYYPGTLDISEAQSVSLGAGQEASVQFAMRPGRTFRISGTVTLPTGAPAAGILSVVATAPSNHRPQPIAPDGSFTLDGMAPGDYLIQVLMSSRGGASGSWPVSIRDADVTGLTLSMTNGTTLRGRLVFEGRPFGAADAPVLRLLPRERRVGEPFSPFGIFASVGADGQFEVAGVAGPIFFDIDPKWMITSVTVGGIEMVDAAIDPAGKDAIAGIRVTATDRLTSVAGRVTADRDGTADGYDVVLLRLDGVPVPPALGLRAVRTDQAGRFETRGLRPGSYVAAALEDVEPGMLYSPDFQERLRAVGHRFSLDDGQAVTLDLSPEPRLP